MKVETGDNSMERAAKDSGETRHQLQEDIGLKKGCENGGENEIGMHFVRNNLSDTKKLEMPQR